MLISLHIWTQQTSCGLSHFYYVFVPYCKTIYARNSTKIKRALTIIDFFAFYRSQNDLCLFKIFEPDPKLNCILCRSKFFCAGTKTLIYWMEIIYWSGTKRLGPTKNFNQFLVWYKKFGPVQFFGTRRRKRHLFTRH